MFLASERVVVCNIPSEWALVCSLSENIDVPYHKVGHEMFFISEAVMTPEGMMLRSSPQSESCYVLHHRAFISDMFITLE
jgi:hypothetical protein